MHLKLRKLFLLGLLVKFISQATPRELESESKSSTFRVGSRTTQWGRFSCRLFSTGGWIQCSPLTVWKEWANSPVIHLIWWLLTLHTISLKGTNGHGIEA